MSVFGNPSGKMQPLVSICIPSRNTRRFLDERKASILAQTVDDYEVIVVDDGSTDGSRGFFEDWAAIDPRVHVFEGPGQGLYPGWNDAIRRVKGEFIYIATSDDTMAPDFLEVMVKALLDHPSSGLAHCCATFIDESGRPFEGRWETWPAVEFFGDLIRLEHVRPRGHDSILSLAFLTPYFSITQLLIRRSLFEECGLFSRKWGPYGDLQWQMRATLLTSTVHVPAHLATWRMHQSQASNTSSIGESHRRGLFIRMAEEHLVFSRKIQFPVRNGLSPRLLRFFVKKQIAQFWFDETRIGRVGLLCRFLLREPHASLSFVKDFLARKSGSVCGLNAAVQRELRCARIDNPLENQEIS